MEKIKLVPYTLEDYEFVYNVKKDAYKEYVEECWGPWNDDIQKELFKKFIETVKNNAYIIMYENKKIGFYNGEIIENGNYEIGNICIIKEYQGRGIGTKILKEKLKEYKNKNIEIQYFKQNPVGKLYERLGFVPNGEKQFHYLMIKKRSDNMLSPKMETERLILRRYEEKDLEAFYEIIHDKRLQKYIFFPDLTKDEELEYIRNCINEVETSKLEKWSIVLKENKETIGNISVNTVNKKHNYCNVGYVIRYNYWGNGYTAEALKKVSDYLLESGYYLVECTCNELNIQSSRVMEKAGFKKDGCIPNRRLNKDGTYSGVEYYSKMSVNYKNR